MWGRKRWDEQKSLVWPLLKCWDLSEKCYWEVRRRRIQRTQFLFPVAVLFLRCGVGVLPPGKWLWAAWQHFAVGSNKTSYSFCAPSHPSVKFDEVLVSIQGLSWEHRTPLWGSQSSSCSGMVFAWGSPSHGCPDLLAHEDLLDTNLQCCDDKKWK